MNLVLAALSNAITIQKPDEGLIFHTDLGSQYISDAFEEAMKDAKMRHSFSRSIGNSHSITNEENHIFGFSFVVFFCFTRLNGWISDCTD
ncbi:hypothetical protein [Sporosarcina limicola]|uniref:hypothetical protein n=1 Tax=Sporosarcina limicola TaxID=34101 RepID=UPI003B82CE32